MATARRRSTAIVPSPVQNVLNGEANGTTTDRIPTLT
jgi:hypothetical protein